MDTTPRLYVQQFDSDKGESVHLEHEPRDFPVTLEGPEPVEPTPWELIFAGAQWALLALAVIALLLAAAGFFFNH